MIEELKKIKLEELNKQKFEYEEKVSSIKQKSNDISVRLYNLQTELSTGLTVTKHFSIWEKLFTKRYEYKRFKEQSKRLREIPSLINSLDIELHKENQKIDEELKETGISTKLKEVTNEINLVENSKTLYDIGLTPIDAIKFLENHGIQPVLSEADKVIIPHKRNYSSKSALIGVHKTKYAPTGNIIKSSKDSNAEYKKTVMLNNKEYQYSFNASRNTVHMAMNDEVSSHMYGSWEDCQYAILIPFEDIPNEKIGRAAPMDTFTRGSIELSQNSWLLCPKAEVDKLKTFNPKIHVLGYEGESVKGFSTPFLTQLGYRSESVGMWGWADEESDKQFYDLIKNEGIKKGTHSYTYFSEDEKILLNINQAVALSKLIRDNNLINSQEDIKNIINQLNNEHNCSFGIILNELCTKTQCSTDIEPQSIKGNNKQVDIFINEMCKNGFDISPAYQNILKCLSKIDIYNDYHIEFPTLEDASEEEQKTIKDFQSIFTNTDNFIRLDIWNLFISNIICNSILHSKEKNFEEDKSMFDLNL